MLPTPNAPVPGTTVVVGVDTHTDTHHAAVLDLNGRLEGDAAFPATPAGYQALVDWAGSYGIIDRIGVELTSSYGAGLTRALTGAGIHVLQVNTTDKATRARRGKDDRSDAIAAAQKVLAGMATAIPKDTTGVIESIRMLTLVRNSAVKSRTQALNQIKDLLVTAPTPLREQLRRFSLPTIAKHAAALQPDTGRYADPAHAAEHALKRLGHRVAALNDEITAADQELRALTTATAPTLLARPGLGVHTTAQFLITAAENIDRITSDAAFARLCGAAPVPVSSGQTHRMRLHRGGDRQANRALHMIIIGRMKTAPDPRAYITRRLTEGLSKRDTTRALKRYVARQVFNDLKTDLTKNRHP
ncbi:IS110 family transposase [Agromyces sp. Marseille-P2726]|uniref:IS110 family transposase n=1 Tax=Agromyces sp. Marseille-P2726 TaxID=2709132 RepID=UPI00156D80C5|nr:IS110 family transposase [Agromyces sp. Marseille-P2726]